MPLSSRLSCEAKWLYAISRNEQARGSRESVKLWRVMNMNPWRSMWTHPRATIRMIVAENPKKSLWVLAFISGLNSLFGFWGPIFLGGIVPLLAMLVLAPFMGLLLFAIWSGLLLLTGRVLKGQGDFQQIRAAQAWASLPLLVVIGLNFILIMISLIMMTTSQIVMMPNAVLILFNLAKLGFSIWSLVLFLGALAEVQRFSVIRAVGNLAMAIILFLVIWVVLVSLIGLIVR